MPATKPEALGECARAAGLYACFAHTELVGFVASSRTALRVGRQIVGIWTFLSA